MNISLLGTALMTLIAVGIFGRFALKAKQRNETLRHILAGISIIAFSFPMTFALTLLLIPFWSWLEDRYGIEAIGHSGPSEWCFAVVFFVCLSTLTCIYVFKRRHEN
jgi:hypothetical protein